MVNVNLTQRDIDYISRVVNTEVPRSLARKNPAEYDKMVRAVVDTVVNRMASPDYPATATGVLNQNRQFSKITGPSYLDPYGSVQNTPAAPQEVQSLVAGHIADRALGMPSTIGGAVSYANPKYSSLSNLTSWVNPMIEAGAQVFGVGNAKHYHGTPPGQFPAPPTTVTAEAIPSTQPPSPADKPDMTNYGLMADAPIGRGLLGDVSAATPVSAQSFDMGRFGPQETMQAGFDMGRFGAPSQMQAGLMPSATQTPSFSPISTAAAAEIPAQSPSPGMAEQYAQYGIGREALLNNPAYREALAIENLKADVGPLNRPPQVQVQPVQTQPTYTDPAVTVQTPAEPQQTVAGPMQPTVNAPAVQAPATGLLGNAAFAPADMAYGAKMERQMANRNMIGGIGGGLLGGVTLGPVGALLGGLLGRQVATRTFYPDAPKAVQGGRAKERDPRQSDAYRDSKQFRDAVDKGGVGLW